MPLLSGGAHVCDTCGSERTIKPGQWLVSESDPSVFTTPPCPTCGSQESFAYHDEVYLKTVQERRPYPPEIEGGPERTITITWEEPDPDNFHARQMVEIEAVAQKLKREKKKLPGRDKGPKYPKPPTPLGRADAEKRRGPPSATEETPDERGRTREAAEAAYARMVELAEQETTERTAAKARAREESHRAKQEEKAKLKDQRPKPPEPEEVPPEVIAELAHPIVDDAPRPSTAVGVVAERIKRRKEREAREALEGREGEEG